jgi:RNA polymerase sigma factor (sigma-70 family)
MSPSVTVRLLATQSDARLVDLARHGHERAFEAFVQRYRRPLLGYCRRVLLPEARAEDALQQALLQAWVALQRGDEVRDARAWLYRIVHNTALNALRSSGYDYAELTEALSGTHAPHEDLDRRIAVREALAGLAALPEQQREALLRTAVEGASHADAAAEMGVSEGALRGLVYRARASLRTAVTALTPMPLASWAAGAAGHGGGAVAELAAGGGSAGLAGLLAKGGVVVLTAGALTAGVGTVEQHRRAQSHDTRRPVHAARADTAGRPAAGAPGGGLIAATPVTAAETPTADESPAPTRHHAHHRHHRREAAAAPVVPRERAPEAPVSPHESGRAEDGGGVPPRHEMSDRDHDGPGGGGGLEHSGRHAGDRLPGSGSAPRGGDHERSGSGPGSGGHDGDDDGPVEASGTGDHRGSRSGGGERSGESGGGSGFSDGGGDGSHGGDDVSHGGDDGLRDSGDGRTGG